jgi:hypothetical protein
MVSSDSQADALAGESADDGADRVGHRARSVAGEMQAHDVAVGFREPGLAQDKFTDAVRWCSSISGGSHRLGDEAPEAGQARAPPGRVVATIQVRGHRQTRLDSGGADKAEDLLAAVERLTRPVFGDFREESMLDGVPLGRARGIVGHREREATGIREEFGFPAPTPAAIAAAGSCRRPAVGQRAGQSALVELLALATITFINFVGLNGCLCISM